jgi:hypothetical protein
LDELARSPLDRLDEPILQGMAGLAVNVVADSDSQEGSLTMVIHEVWIEGGATPVVLELEDDKLFQQFKQWVEKDNALTANGWVGIFGGKTWVINFQKVAYITTSPKKDRPSMGFGPT